VLDDALKDAGIARGEIYLTNAVKHFKFEQRGKLRLHQRPSARDVAACRPWVEAELETLRPRAVVCLGATAGQALLGSGFRLGPMRGKPQQTTLAPFLLATWHPAALLRAGSPAQAEAMRRELVDDLRLARAQSALP
jgi:DNA polymerase